MHGPRPLHNSCSAEIGVDVTGPVCQFSSRNAGEPALGPLGRQATGPVCACGLACWEERASMRSTAAWNPITNCGGGRHEQRSEHRSEPMA